MNYRSVFAAAATLGSGLLAACASLPDMAPPAQATDAQALDPGSPLRRAAAADAAWPAQDWWNIYGDSQLDGLVRQALAENPSLRAAQSRVTQAQGLSQIARGATLPHVDGKSDLTRTYGSHDAHSPDLENRYTYWENTGLVQISYDLDLWGKDRAALEGALDNVHAAEVELRAAQLNLSAAVTQNYIELAGQYMQREVAQANLARQQKALDIARRRNKAGIGSLLEQTEASTVVPETQGQIEAIDQHIALLRNQLAALAGAGPGYGERLAPPRLKLDRATQVPASLPAALVGHRPDVVAQRWMVQASARNIDVAKARFYPDVNLVAAGGIASFGFSRAFTGSTATGEFGPAISLPIFEGGALRGNLRAQRAAYDAAVDSYNSAVIGAVHEVADEVVSLQSLEKQLQRTDEALKFARTAENQAEQGFRAGLTDYLSVLNTQAELLVQQRNRAQLVAVQMETYAALMKALGGGFEEPAPAPARK